MVFIYFYLYLFDIIFYIKAFSLLIYNFYSQLSVLQNIFLYLMFKFEYSPQECSRSNDFARSLVLIYFVIIFLDLIASLSREMMMIMGESEWEILSLLFFYIYKWRTGGVRGGKGLMGDLMSFFFFISFFGLTNNIKSMHVK